jgi:histidinol phosphatase-like PHP family hydrolase
MDPLYAQDLHIHTIFSAGDSAVSKEQTVELVAKVNHAKIIGISDHFEYIWMDNYLKYKETVTGFGFKLGTEIEGYKWVDSALNYDFDYYIYHCWDDPKDYKGLEKLMSGRKPVIVAHPYATGTNLDKIPENSIVEINNRYISRYDWSVFFSGYLNKFRFVLGSDAHQPNWLNLNISRYVANDLGIREEILF